MSNTGRRLDHARDLAHLQWKRPAAVDANTAQALAAVNLVDSVSQVSVESMVWPAVDRTSPIRHSSSDTNRDRDRHSNHLGLIPWAAAGG